MPPNWICSLLLALVATPRILGDNVAPLPLYIGVGANASTGDKFAATELQSLLGTLCPAMHFTVGAPSKGKAQWIVGPDSALQLGVPASDLQGLGNESFIADSTSIIGSVIISGGINSARGTLYAVYVFLDKMGIKFLAHDETIVPECPASLPVVKMAKVSPSYEYRDDNQKQVSSQMAWATRVGFNGPSSHQPPQQGNYIKYASPPGFVHTSYALFGLGAMSVPPAKYYTEHPEWFWPRGESGAKTYGQLCWNNASLIEFMIGQVKNILRSQPDANIISVSQNDNYNRCMDPAEEKINNEEGSPMGALLRGVNSIASAIADEFPNVAVDTLAYQWSRPATKVTKPLPNVVVRLCSIECDFAHPLSHPNNAAFQHDINAWFLMSNRTYIWDYITNFQNYFVPFPNWYVLGENIKFFHEHGVLGIFEEGTYSTTGGDLVELKDYVIARSLFNVTSDPLDHIRTFLRGYYGEAAPFIQLYMDIMHGAVAETNYYMHESFDWHAAFLTPIALLESARAFSQARSVVTGRFLERVERASMPTQFVGLLRWEELQAFANATSLTWPFLPTKRAQLDDFSKLYNTTGVTRLNEGGRDIKWLEQQLFPTAKQILAGDIVV